MAWVPGMMMQRTSGCTWRPRSTSAASTRSFQRPFVHEPITAWSIVTSPTWLSGRALEGRCGKATTGSTAEASISTVRTYSAPGSAAYGR